MSRRKALGLGAAALTSVLAGCGGGQLSECDKTRLQEERDNALVASVDGSEYTNEIELTLNFWDAAGSDANPTERVRVFDNSGELAGEFRAPAGTRSATGRVDKGELKPAYVQLYGESDSLLETREVEVRCS
jgi:hypothetical protein